MLPWGDGWGPSLLCTLARIDGAPVGIVANQPLVRAGALDPDPLDKEQTSSTSATRSTCRWSSSRTSRA